MGKDSLPVPTREIQTKLTEVGKLRLGRKVPRNQGGRESLATWRLTSSDYKTLEQVAAIYGGTVRPWDERSSTHTHELITEAPELRIALPPNALDVTDYLLWDKGTLTRRCDGETCTVRRVQQTNDGADITEKEIDCICWGKQLMECDQRKVRLQVLLPDVRVGGSWGLQTAGAAALKEIPGMVGLIREAAAVGLPYAVLRIEARSSMVNGRKSNYRVPVLGLDHSLEQLAAGAASVGAIGPASETRVAIGTGNPEYSTGTDVAVDDGITDAEIVPEPTFDPKGADVLCQLCPDPLGTERIVPAGAGYYAHARCVR